MRAEPRLESEGSRRRPGAGSVPPRDALPRPPVFTWERHLISAKFHFALIGHSEPQAGQRSSADTCVPKCNLGTREYERCKKVAGAGPRAGSVPLRDALVCDSKIAFVLKA